MTVPAFSGAVSAWPSLLCSAAARLRHDEEGDGHACGDVGQQLLLHVVAHQPLQARHHPRGCVPRRLLRALALERPARREAGSGAIRAAQGRTRPGCVGQRQLAATACGWPHLRSHRSSDSARPTSLARGNSSRDTASKRRTSGGEKARLGQSCWNAHEQCARTAARLAAWKRAAGNAGTAEAAARQTVRIGCARGAQGRRRRVAPPAPCQTAAPAALRAR